MTFRLFNKLNEVFKTGKQVVLREYSDEYEDYYNVNYYDKDSDIMDVNNDLKEYKNKKSNWIDWFTEHADIPLNEKDACRFAVNEFVKELRKTLHNITTGELTKGDLDKALKLLGVEVSL